MSDDNATIVDDGATVPMDPADEAVFKFDWDESHLDSGCIITDSVFTITAVKPLGAALLTKDNPAILSAAPYNSRWTRIRLIGGGDLSVGHVYEITNTITTNESPTQEKNRSFRVSIEQM